MGNGRDFPKLSTILLSFFFFLKFNTIRSSPLKKFLGKSLFCVFLKHLDIPSQSNGPITSSQLPFKFPVGFISCKWLGAAEQTPPPRPLHPPLWGQRKGPILSLRPLGKPDTSSQSKTRRRPGTLQRCLLQSPHKPLPINSFKERLSAVKAVWVH